MKKIVILILLFATPVFGGKLSQDEIDYFVAIATNDEYSKKNLRPILRWERDIRIQVKPINCELKQADWDNLNQVIADINQILEGKIKLSIVTQKEKPNVRLHFVKGAAELSRISQGRFNAGGFALVAGSPPVGLAEANIGIDITYAPAGVYEGMDVQKLRNHLVREELVQSLGLLADSHKYKDSMFYEDWENAEQNHFSPIDVKMIKLLYNPALKVGMWHHKVRLILKDLEIESEPVPAPPPSFVPVNPPDPSKALKEEITALKALLESKTAELDQANRQLDEKETLIQDLKNKEKSYVFHITTLETALESKENPQTTPYTSEWFYDPNKGWLWTNKDTFPYFYSSELNGWLMYKEGTSAPRLFYNYTDETWEEWQ